ncbi:ferritin family protein [candidate division KSB1 bacterium]|nr:ferritin family protein [candidate division KSB1 bacterium]
MKRFNSVEEILNYSIAKEQESSQFYNDLAGRVERPEMSRVFEDFAQEEMGHKAKLLSIKQGKLLMPAERKILDLKIGDYLVGVEPGPDLDYQQVLVLAMKKEKESFRLYTDLAAATDDSNLGTTLQSLAQEEAKHKLRFEIEYDDHILAQD